MTLDVDEIGKDPANVVNLSDPTLLTEDEIADMFRKRKCVCVWRTQQTHR
jgi:hypothetical protein